ncbi:MAG: molybdenum cofactor guanylyltransferase [Clostridiales Family XIII bacterium]|nr:molybdenum cofactor guanylyltransferase [Clostridiales Family XIII bacterium]
MNSEAMLNKAGLATAVVLAGGRSRRMGTDKALLLLDGMTLIEHAVEKFRASIAFDEILISANRPEAYAFLGLPVVPDRFPGDGPLAGMQACLETAKNEYVSFVPCDAPRIPPGLPAWLLKKAQGHDAACPVFRERPEPLLSCVRKTALPAISNALSAGERRAADVFARLDTAYIDLAGLTDVFGEPGEYLVNANDPETFRRVSASV